MEIFTQGAGDKTFVFMSGSGTSRPVIDFKPLWQPLAETYRIVVIEKYGYGESAETKNPRDLKTMVEENRKSLIKMGLLPPYILVAHSMSALEAIYWTHNYSTEIEAFIGLDPAVPEVYDFIKIPSNFAINIAAFVIRLRLHNLFIKLLWKNQPWSKSPYLTYEDKADFFKFFRKNPLTLNMRNECRMVKHNAKTAKENLAPDVLPILFFISNQNINGWKETLINYLSNFKQSRYFLLEAGHYIHLFEPQIIADKIKEFI